MSRRHIITESRTDLSTILLIQGETEISDSSVYHHTIANTGVMIQDNSMYFDGSSMLNVNIGDLKITDGVFTLEMWLKLANVNKSYKCVVDLCDHQVLYFDASDNRDGTLVLVGGRASWQANGSYLMSADKNVFLSTQWQHVAIVGDGTKNRIFVNGILKTGYHFDNCTNLLNMGNGKIRFGNIALNMSRYYRGWMKHIRLSNVARYTGNFDVTNL